MHTQFTTLAELHRLGAKAEPIGQSWLRAYADKLEINTYAVEGLLGMACDGATLEALTERHAAIRTAVTDPKRLERAGWIFGKVLEGEREVWPTRPAHVPQAATHPANPFAGKKADSQGKNGTSRKPQRDVGIFRRKRRGVW